MRKLAAVLILLSCAAYAIAQTPVSPAPASPTDSEPATPWLKTFTSDAGFSYSYPSDWELVDSKPMLPVAKLHAQESAHSDTERQAVDCTQIALIIRHGLPHSVVVVVVLPYACMGNSLKQSDLVGVAGGMAKGIQKSFTVTEPSYAAYKSGNIEFSAERAKGSPKAHPEITQTLETSCGMFKKALVCWLGFASNDEDLHTFENGAVTADGGNPFPLMPSDAFDPKKRK